MSRQVRNGIRFPASLYSNLRQFTETIKFSPGLIRHCEVGMDFPLIDIFFNYFQQLWTW